MAFKKGTIGALGGAAAGYYLWKNQPFIGAVLGFFLGRTVGTSMDKSARIKQQQAEAAATIEPGTSTPNL